MILTYHSITETSTTENECSVESFKKQVKNLISQNYSFVYLSEYDSLNPKQIVLRFDDGYKNVLKNALPILQKYNLPFECFISACNIKRIRMSELLHLGGGGLNSLDLIKLVRSGARLQYHGKTHLKLHEISDIKILKKEIVPSKRLKIFDKNGFEFFAYPFWRFNDSVLKIVQENFKGAVSGNGFGDGSKYQMDSIKVLDCMDFRDGLQADI